MNIVERVKKICLSPKSEWPVIAEETTATGSLITGYVLPLAALAAIAGFIGGSIIGHSIPFVGGGTFRTPITTGIGLAVFQVIMSVVMVFVISFIISALAPAFGGEKNSAQALKVAVYAYTPGWLAAVFQMIPGLVFLSILGLYGLYLLYLGLPRLMKVPEDKAIGYTLVVVVCAIVLSLAVGAVGAMFVGTGAGMMGKGGMLSGAMHNDSAAPEMQFDKNSTLGKLQEMGKQMEAAQKSGDVDAQAKVTAAMMGTLISGGKHADPVSVEQIKSFVPDTLAGFPRRTLSAERSGMANLMVSRAEANYGDNSGKDMTLEISDTGGISGLTGLAGWAGVEGQKEDQDNAEITQKVNGRLVHERVSKTGGQNEFDMVVADRFVVAARGNLDISRLKDAVTGIDLNRLEGLKDSGVQK